MSAVRVITNNQEYEERRKQIVLSRKKISGTTPISPECYQKLLFGIPRNIYCTNFYLKNI